MLLTKKTDKHNKVHEGLINNTLKVNWNNLKRTPQNQKK